MKRNKRARRVKVSADGQGVVSHAGVGLLREMAEFTGFGRGPHWALIDTYKGVPVHAPGRVFTDLASAPSPTERTRSAGSVCFMIAKTCSVRSRRCRPRGGCWTASTQATWVRFVPLGARHANVRGPRVPARTLAKSCGWTSTRRSRSRVREGECCCYLEENLWVPPAAVLLGPSRGRQRGGPGRAAAQGQRRIEHRRRPHHGAEDGPGVVARVRPASTW